MSKFCPNCNFELADTDNICPNCGHTEETADLSCGVPIEESPVQETPVLPDLSAAEEEQIPENNEPAPEVKAPARKLKWWMVAVPVVLVIALAVALCWNSLRLHIAPEQVLAAALTEAGMELTQRQDGSPLTLLTNFDDADAYTLDYGIECKDSYGNDMTIDISIISDMVNVRNQIDCDLSFMGIDLDLSAYLDRDYIAISSQELTEGEYYGITFDTFLEDAQSNPLFESADAQELETFQSMFDSISASLDSGAQRAGLNEESEFTDEYIAAIKDFYSNLKPNVDKKEWIADGQNVNCDVIVYQASGDDLTQLLSQFFAVLEQDEAMQTTVGYAFGYMDDSENSAWDNMINDLGGSTEAAAQICADSLPNGITVEFYLYHKELVGICSSTDIKNDQLNCSTSFSLTFGTDLSEDDISISLSVQDWDDNENSATVYMTVSTQKTDDSYTETLSIRSVDRDGIESNAEINYSWVDRSDLTLGFMINDGFEEESFQIDMTLQQTETGFEIDIENLLSVFEATEGDLDISDGAVMTFYMEISEGGEVSVPAYKNVSEWTQEDMLRLAMKLAFKFS